MSQTDQQQTQPRGAGAGAGAGGPADPSDPLASLHKMSTTAGLGSTDYVEVNAAAIAALVLGLLSAVTLFNEPLLLVVPAVGVLTAIVAFRQIAKSNGTQTGSALAAGAILLSLIFGGIMFFRFASERSQTSRAKAQIGTLVIEFSNQLKAGQFDTMYQMFDQRFRERINRERFGDTMKYIQGNEVYGKLKSVTLPGMPGDAAAGYRWNGLAEFVKDEANGEEMATAQLVWNFEKQEGVRQQAWFRETGGKWLFEDMPALFPRERKPGEPPG